MTDAAQVRSAYNRWAGSYDGVANPTRDLDQQVTRRLLEGQHFAHALELGCGTGKNTSLLAGLAGELVALDFSEGMLAQARQKLSRKNVHFVIADIQRTWPFADDRFDLIACNLVLEHVAGLAPVFAQMRRCLAPGGRLLVSELHPYKQYLGSQARFQHQGQEWKIPAHVHHLSDFTAAAAGCGLSLLRLDEWWDEPGEGPPPRLLSFMFRR